MCESLNFAQIRVHISSRFDFDDIVESSGAFWHNRASKGTGG